MQQLPEPTLGTYLALIVRIGWGLIILFGMVGTLAGHAAGPFVILISAAIWVSMKILFEALWCIRLWQVMGSREDEDEPPDGPAQ